MSEMAPQSLSASPRDAGRRSGFPALFPLLRRAGRELFQVEARFTGFTERKHGLPKRMMVHLDGKFCSVKISKPLRSRIESQLTPGARIHISGEAKWDKGQCKMKAYAIDVLGPGTDLAGPNHCILVCSERNCCQRGAPLLWKTLKQTLEKSGLSEQVALEPSGCLKNCKRGPSFMVLPEGTVHGGLNAGTLRAVLTTISRS
jgi:(2Fe-2S) ferredoxin